MIIPIDLKRIKIFVSLEEYCKHRLYYELLLIKELGKIIINDVPEYHSYLFI